ncbi:MAG: hypothetical protein CMG00_07325 [Candidatus Marinimicrobia bacterium]|nr:hypothetical protein [Candidatus Neomarinimicrobiota bacterium]
MILIIVSFGNVFLEKMNKRKEIDITEISKTLKQGKRIIIYSTIGGFFISLLYLFLATPYYQSYISINPIGDSINKSQSIGGLQGLVSQYGVDINLSNFDNDKPSFYIPDIVNSRVLKKSVIENQWKTNEHDSIDLISYWGINDSNKFSFTKLFNLKSNDGFFDLESKFMDLAIDKLSDQMLVKEQQSGLIVITILMEEPQLAADISNYIAEYIKEYISESVILHTSEHRKFIEQRLRDSKKELSESEEELKNFSEKHPFAIDSPELQLLRGRLMRNMEVNQQVYITLRQQYEMAKINELNKIPVIAILDSGEPAYDQQKPQRLLIVILSIFMSFIFSCIILIIKKEIQSNDD